MNKDQAVKIIMIVTRSDEARSNALEMEDSKKEIEMPKASLSRDIRSKQTERSKDGRI